MKTLKQYIEAQTKLQTYYQRQKKIRKETEKKLYENKYKYRDLISNLEKEQYKAEREITEKKETAIDEIDSLLTSVIPIQDEFKRIMNFFLLQENNKKGTKLKTPEVYKYQNSNEIFYEPIESIVQDLYKTISVYITENRKPVNKYNLLIIGNTIFNEDVMNLKHDYGLDVLTDHANIQIYIKSASSKEALQEYFNKNKTKIVQKILEEFNTAEQEYKETLELFNQKEWKIAFLQYQKLYYEIRYSHGTETEEYKDIVRKLNNLLK